MAKRGRITGIIGAVMLLILVLPITTLAADRSPDQVYIDWVEVKVGNPGLDGTSPVTTHVSGQVPICKPLTEDVSRQGSTVSVTIAPRPLKPGEITCQAIGLREYDKDFHLGRFGPGTYTLKVNGSATTLTVGDVGNETLGPLSPMLARFFGSRAAWGDPGCSSNGRVLDIDAAGLARGKRLGEVVPLLEVCTQVPQRRKLASSLDPLGNDLYAKRMTEIDDAGNDPGFDLVLVNVLDEGPVDFHMVHRIALHEVEEPGLPGVEVINRELNPERLEYSQHRMGGLAVFDDHILGKLKGQSGGSQPGL